MLSWNHFQGGVRVGEDVNVYIVEAQMGDHVFNKIGITQNHWKKRSKYYTKCHWLERMPFGEAVVVENILKSKTKAHRDYAPCLSAWAGKTEARTNELPIDEVLVHAMNACKQAKKYLSPGSGL